jgi:hypothetical protein
MPSKKLKNTLLRIKPFLNLTVKDLSQSVMSRKKNIKPVLPEIKKENPYKVPDGYFDRFSGRMADKIAAANHERKEWKFLFLTKPQLIFVSSFVVLVFIAYGIFRFTNIDHPSEKLTHQEIAKLIEDDIFNYDENMIIENYEETYPVEEIVIESVIQEPVTDITSDEEYSEEIIEYLVEEDIDLESIVQEL